MNSRILHFKKELTCNNRFTHLYSEVVEYGKLKAIAYLTKVANPEAECLSHE
jgi:hypothetical protein